MAPGLVHALALSARGVLQAVWVSTMMPLMSLVGVSFALFLCRVIAGT